MRFDLADAVAVLDRTPAVLREWLAAAPAAWVSADEGPDTWSPFDVLGHLIGGEETDWVPRARIILAQGADRRFEPFDRTAGIRATRGRTADQLLRRFAELRERNLAELRSWRLTPEQLRWTGEHPDFGTVTLEQLLATWVVHDLGHLAQIGRVMAKQYRDAVGPWQAYLPVLHR